MDLVSAEYAKEQVGKSGIVSNISEELVCYIVDVWFFQSYEILLQSQRLQYQNVTTKLTVFCDRVSVCDVFMFFVPIIMLSQNSMFLCVLFNDSNHENLCRNIQIETILLFIDLNSGSVLLNFSSKTQLHRTKQYINMRLVK